MSIEKEEYPTIQQTLRNPMNNSSSKFQYTFCKAERFKKQRKNNSEYRYYDIPSTQSKRGAIFGESQRGSGFKVIENIPSPGQYHFQSQFNKTKYRGIIFGSSRQDLKINNFMKIIQGPGPGQYSPNPQYVQHKIAIPYSLGKKLHTEKTIESLPGPGSYKVQTPLIFKQKILSKDTRYGCPKIILDKNFSRKIKTQTSELSHYEIPKYTVKGEQLNFGKKGFSIGREQRFRIKKKDKFSVPGPGYYKKFSQFINSRK